MDFNLCIDHSILSYIDTESSTWKGLTDMGMFSPRGGTRQYRVTCSTMICFRFTQAGVGARSDAALYHPFIWCHDYLCMWGSKSSSASISSPASSFLRCWSAFRLAFIMRLSHQMNAWSRAGYRSAETLVLTSLHMSTDIHAFFCASRVFCFGIARQRAATSLSTLVGVVGCQRGIRVRLPRYFLFSLRVALRMHPRIK